MTEPLNYTITYHLTNGDFFSLPAQDTEPNIEMLEISDKVEIVEVRSLQPMEHELMFEDPELEKHPYLYQGLYFPNAEIIDYQTAQEKIDPGDIDRLRHYAYESIDYGHRFIGHDKEKKPEDLKYIYNATTNRVHIFSVNSAVLQKIPENSQGLKWKKINTAAMELGLA